jgi:hypothetical protein
MLNPVRYTRTMSRPYPKEAVIGSATHNVTGAGQFIDRNANWFAAIFLVATGILGCVKCYYRPLWYDEILTALTARLPTAHDIVAICKAGGDGQPPLYYFLVRPAIHLFQNEAIGIRILSLGGYLLLCLALYVFVARRTARPYGLIAMLIPGVTDCWYYAAEGRPYGIVLGCTGLAMISWQSATGEKKRAASLVTLSLALALAFNVHYYAPLLIVPFAIAEGMRLSFSRRPDWGMWLALCIPCATIVAWLPVAMEGRKHLGTHWGKPTWFGSPQETLTQFLTPGITALFLLLLVVYVLRGVLTPVVEQVNARVFPKSVRFTETALALSLTFLPLFQLLFAKLVTHAYVPRYVIETMAGVSVVAAFSLSAIFGQMRGPAAIVLLALTIAFAARTTRDVQVIRDRNAVPAAVTMRKRVPDSLIADQLPIAVSNPYTFLEFRYYLPKDIDSKMWYVYDENAAMRFSGFTGSGFASEAEGLFFHANVAPYADFVRSHRDFYVFGDDEFYQWLVPKLVEDGERLTVLQGKNIDRLYKATSPGSP